MEVRDLYCYQCSLQFDKKCIFNDHLSDVHGIVFDVKRVPGFQPLVLSDFHIGNTQNKGIEEPSTSKSEESGKKEKHKASIQEKMKQCGLCTASFERKETFVRPAY